MNTDGKRDVKTVETRRTRIDRERVRGNMIMGMGVVAHFADIEPFQERGPDAGEFRGGETGGGTSSVGRVFDKIQVPTDKSESVRSHGREGTDQLGVEREVAPRLEVEIKHLKGGTRGVPRSVLPELDMSLGQGIEGDVRTDKKLLKVRSVDNKGASLVHTEVVARYLATPQGRKGLPFSGGQISFLETDNVVGFDKVGDGT